MYKYPLDRNTVMPALLLASRDRYGGTTSTDKLFQTEFIVFSVIILRVGYDYDRVLHADLQNTRNPFYFMKICSRLI